MAKIKHLALRKYLKLRDIHGHEKATEFMTQQESDEIFSLILRCSTPENYDEATGGFIIREGEV